MQTMKQTIYRYLLMVSLVCALVLPSIPLSAQSRDDEVMVSTCSEVYEFKMKGGQPIVKNKTVIEYESLRQYDENPARGLLWRQHQAG